MRDDWIPYAIGAAIGLLLLFPFLYMADEAKEAKEYCASIGMFPSKNAGEWICINRPEWRRVP